MDDEHLNNQTSLRINPAVIQAEASKVVSSSNRFANAAFPLQQSARVIYYLSVVHTRTHTYTHTHTHTHTHTQYSQDKQ